MVTSPSLNTLPLVLRSDDDDSDGHSGDSEASDSTCVREMFFLKHVCKI